MNASATMIILLTALCASAQGDTQDLLQQGIDAYRQGLDARQQDLRLSQFRRAYQLFHQAAQQDGSVHADLYVNMGNAALLSAQRGEAILAYRRALAIDPGHARARQNLEHARAQMPAWVPRPAAQTLLDTLFGWGRMLSPGGRLRLAALCFTLAALLLALSIRYRWAAVRTFALLPLAAWLALIAAALWAHFASEKSVEAVLLSDQVAHAADSANAPTRFAEPLPAGTEVRVLTQRDGFSYVRLADDRDAWVRSSSLSHLGG
jgi:tetratricopeptide (TPR) repeat protein